MELTTISGTLICKADVCQHGLIYMTLVINITFFVLESIFRQMKETNETTNLEAHFFITHFYID